MNLKINKNLVSIDWLFKNLDNDNLIILDATLQKVTAKKNDAFKEEKKQIRGAKFFDIKNVFSNVDSPFPNTILAAKKFEVEAQKLGINSDSSIVVYDDLGIYSSPRVWWMFRLMGFQNIAVLNGGLPAWKANNHPIEKPQNSKNTLGNFKAVFKVEKIKFTKDILKLIGDKKSIIVDARSKGRFFGTEPEPRKEVKSGHIPNSVNLPFSNLIEKGKMFPEKELELLFRKINPNKLSFIFSCGTGITASVLALGAEISGYKNHSVYDGSWTEWGSIENLPIEI